MTALAYWIDHLGLESGNKTAGFIAAIAGDDARLLAALQVTSQEQAECQARVLERLSRAKLMKKVLQKHSGVAFYKGSALPVVFSQDPIFGGTLGREYREFDEVINGVLRDEGELDVLRYYPHNVDIAAQALSLMVVIQTWAEWARERILLAEMKTKECAHGKSS